MALHLEFTSLAYGKIDNIKISNALMKSYAIEGNKKKYIELLNKGFEISTLLNLQKHTNKHIVSLLPKDFIKEINKAINKEIMKSHYAFEDLLKIIRFNKKINKNRQNLIVNGKSLYKYYFENNIPKLLNALLNTQENNKSEENIMAYTKNTIDRTNQNVLENNLYTHYTFHLKEKLLILKVPENTVDEILHKIKMLGISGLSKRKSIGYGKYKIIKKKEFNSVEELIKKYEIPLLDNNKKYFFGKLLLDLKDYSQFINKINHCNSYYEINPIQLIHADGRLSPTFMTLSEGSSIELLSSSSFNTSIKKYYGYSTHDKITIPNNPLILEGVKNE